MAILCVQILLSIISDSSLQRLPVAIVEGLPLRRYIDKVVGRVLHLLIDEGRMRRQMTLGKVVSATQGCLNYLGAISKEVAAQKSSSLQSLIFLGVWAVIIL